MLHAGGGPPGPVHSGAAAGARSTGAGGARGGQAPVGGGGVDGRRSGCFRGRPGRAFRAAVQELLCQQVRPSISCVTRSRSMTSADSSGCSARIPVRVSGSAAEIVYALGTLSEIQTEFLSELVNAIVNAGDHSGLVGHASESLGTSDEIISIVDSAAEPHRRQLRQSLGRKDHDIFKMVNQIVNLQRNMYRPQRVQVCSSPWPSYGGHTSMPCPDVGRLALSFDHSLDSVESVTAQQHSNCSCDMTLVQV